MISQKMSAGNMLRLIQGMSTLNIYSTPWSISQRCIGNKAVLERLKAIPQKPKRPYNAYFQFKAEVEPELKRKNPDLNMKASFSSETLMMFIDDKMNEMSDKDLARIVGQLWKECSQEKKDKYKEVAERKLLKYKEELDQMERSLTPQQKAEIEELKNDLNRLRDEKLLRAEKQKRQIEFAKPKRPLNPYIRFIKAQATFSGEAKNVVKDMAAKWANMTESQKKTYVQEYEKECEQYNKKIEAWENKMISLGHFDLVRGKTLKEKAIEE